MIYKHVNSQTAIAFVHELILENADVTWYIRSIKGSWRGARSGVEFAVIHRVGALNERHFSSTGFSF